VILQYGNYRKEPLMCYLTIVVLSYLIGRAMFGPYSTMDRV